MKGGAARRVLRVSSLNNIYKYLGDLLCCGWSVPGSLGTWSALARDTRALTKFVTDSIWRNVNKQLEAAREMPESLRTESSSTASLWSQQLQMGLL